MGFKEMPVTKPIYCLNKNLANHMTLSGIAIGSCMQCMLLIGYQSITWSNYLTMWGLDQQ